MKKSGYALLVWPLGEQAPRGMSLTPGNLGVALPSVNLTRASPLGVER